MNKCNVYDVWRCRNETKRIFSWKKLSNDVLQQRRIDYYLISKILYKLKEITFYFSEHIFVAYIDIKLYNLYSSSYEICINLPLLS
jgi:hypothetical protein